MSRSGPPLGGLVAREIWRCCAGFAFPGMLPVMLLVALVWVDPGVVLAAPDSSQEAMAGQELITKLDAIVADLKQRRADLTRGQQRLQRLAEGPARTALEEDLARRQEAIDQQQRAFELIVTGGQEQATLAGVQEKVFDWQEDLNDILQPIMSELRALTERQRRQEQLRNRIAFHEERLAVVRKALDSIDAITQTGPRGETAAQVAQVRQSWAAQLRENAHLLEVARLEMAEVTQADQEEEISARDMLMSFVHGRGVTLLLAVGAASGVWFALRLVSWLVGQLPLGVARGRLRTYQKLAGLLYHTLASLLALAALFHVLGLRGDRVLVGLMILLLAALALLLKSSVPRYLRELQTLLNLGMVREGERVLFNGLPWRVETLHVFCRLSNPAITTGPLRVPLEALEGLISRESPPDESWFPCRAGDTVLLGDGALGQVKAITPEMVVLAQVGAMRHIPVGDFLAASPLCLSAGFVVAVSFGIDYALQGICTTKVPELFRTGLLERLGREGYASALESLQVPFEEAAASSLNYRILAAFKGDAAPEYYRIRRDLQRFAVEVCNDQGWGIPFPQLTLHGLPANLGPHDVS
ncbi:MAG: hypothetical protein H7831_15840 [Magnetococcus sp. WYHC-3]